MGAGFSIRPNKTKQDRVYFRVSFNVGNSIRYIVRDSFKYDGSSNKITYETGRAPLRYMLIQLGAGM